VTVPIADALLPTCTLWIDGERFADGGTPGELDTDPVALTDLKVVWGRPNSLDQPEPGTCTFRVLDIAGGAHYVDELRIGAKVQVRADATIFPDPTVPVFTFNAGFEGMTVGAVPPSTVQGCTFTVSAGGPPKTGTRSARLDADPGVDAMSVIIPPAAYGGAAAWDGIPRARAGQTWQWGLSVLTANLLLAVQQVKVRPVAFTAPNAAAAAPLYPYTVTVPIGAAGWQTVLADLVPPEGCWLGLMVEVRPAGGVQWDQVPYSLQWNQVGATVQWNQVGAVYVDDLKLLAPAAGALRSGTVFTGRITDMTAAWDAEAGGVVVEVIAQTHLAELDNRYVGDEPWGKEPLSSRFARIVAASGQTISYQIDSSVAGTQVSWRDVDSRPSGDLLHQLAQSVGGALWSAATSAGDAYVWLEDINNRPAMYRLVMDGDGVVRIHLNTALAMGDKAITLDACDVLLEPVQWVQTTEDDATRVVVSWRDQTKDNEGHEAPTQRDITATDSAQEIATGRRRVAVSTELAVETDAALVAQALLARLSSPGWRVSGLTWDLTQVDRVDADTLERVMQVLDGVTRLGLGILLTDVPEWSPIPVGDDVWLFLEGGTFTNTDGAWTLELLTSSGIAQGESDVRWDDLPNVAAPTRYNRATNPRAVSGGANGWLTRGFGTGGAGTYSFITGQTGPAGTGITTAYRKTWTTGATGNGGTGFQVQDTTTKLFALTSGISSVTVSCWIRYSSPTVKTLQMILQFFSQVAWTGGGLISQVNATAVPGPAANTWQRLIYTVAVPAGSLGLLVFPDVAAGGTNWAAGQTMDITGLQIEEVGAVDSYFDGATTDTPALDFGWTGTANASTSQARDVSSWSWDEFDPAISWNDLHGVSL
jgi:hypothetical protein